jgi:hypothetical protein
MHRLLLILPVVLLFSNAVAQTARFAESDKLVQQLMAFKSDFFEWQTADGTVDAAVDSLFMPADDKIRFKGLFTADSSLFYLHLFPKKKVEKLVHFLLTDDDSSRSATYHQHYLLPFYTRTAVGFIAGMDSSHCHAVYHSIARIIGAETTQFELSFVENSGDVLLPEIPVSDIPQPRKRKRQ